MESIGPGPRERARHYRALAQEILRLPQTERRARCRELADEAEDAAATVFGAAGDAYLQIAQNWRLKAENEA
jgi:hypothetical protein